MIVHVSPAKGLAGRVILPASKSYSIRAFLVAACGGCSAIVRPSGCDDAVVARQAARRLGAVVRREGDRYTVTADATRPRLERINVRESGTVLRFLLPLLGLSGKRARVDGEGTLRGRPNRQLLETLRAHGMKIRGKGPAESVPIRMAGGRLEPGRIAIDGTLSSQFVSALLIAGTRLAGDSRVILKGRRLVSGDYITMTRQVLALSGIHIGRMSPREYAVKGGRPFRGLKTFTVPSDYGLAAFLLAAGSLVPSRLVLEGSFNDRLVQADGHILEFLRRMGARCRRVSRSLRLNGPFDLKGGVFSLKDCPDLVPVMAVLALFVRGRTRLTGIRHARAKESDRISDLRRELLKVGAQVEESPDELRIDPLPCYRSHVLLDPHHDHRLAMAFCVLGLKIGVKVKDIECVRKSYPSFLRDFRSLGASCRRSS